MHDPCAGNGSPQVRPPGERINDRVYLEPEGEAEPSRGRKLNRPVLENGRHPVGGWPLCVCSFAHQALSRNRSARPQTSGGNQAKPNERSNGCHPASPSEKTAHPSTSGCSTRSSPPVRTISPGSLPYRRATGGSHAATRLGSLASQAPRNTAFLSDRRSVSHVQTVPPYLHPHS